MSLDHCPEDIKKRGSILYCNGFGLQPPGSGTSNTYVICFCKELSHEDVNMIKSESQSQTLHHDDYIGRPYLEIHWTEYDKIEAILTAMLKHNWSFSLQIKGMPYYSQELGDYDFKWSQLESKLIKIYSKLMQEFWFKEDRDLKPGHLLPFPLFDIWNWKTPEGRDFCNLLRYKSHLPPQNEATDSDNYWNWDIFKSQNLHHLGDVNSQNSISLPDIQENSESPPIMHDDNSEIDTCMVCLDAVANTLVLPCQHQVVCKTCSDQLINTPDQKTCVRCRRPINEILYDQ